MRQNFVRRQCIALSMILLALTSSAQDTDIREYVIFGGNAECPGTSQTIPLSPGCGVQLGTGTTIVSGKVGSYRLVRSTGNVSISNNVHSGGTVQLASSNTIGGNVSVANAANLSTTVFQAGTGGTIQGNVNVRGNTVNTGTIINGTLTHPAGTSYTGPAPVGGNIIGDPSLPGMPVMPGITNFPSAGTTNITGNNTIVPGTYDKILLNGNKTLTFSGPGIYVFNSIKNAGAVNTFIFDFQNNPTGVFKLYIYGDVDLNRSNVMMVNGGSPTRIYAETHGNGSTSSTGTNAWFIANGSGSSNVQISAWAGTVWAPYAGIYVGNQTSTSRIRGALWSGTQVNLVGGVTLEHQPCVIVPPGNIFPYYTPPNNFKVNDIIGSELSSLFNAPSTAQNLSDIFLLSQDSVWIEVIAKIGQRSALATLLTGSVYGLTDTIPNGENNLVITGKYKISKLLLLNGLGNMISFCRPAFPPVSNSGIIQSAGDSTMRTNYIRNGFNVKGEGIRIGVLSDSYNTLANDPASLDVANDDLPGRSGNTVNPHPVRVLQEFPLGRRSDEGRAMLQIIHDVAPKAKLSFRTGFLTPGDFALGIRQLSADTCNVIVDDITFITEPFFTEGVVEKAIQAVAANGVHYVTAAGNFGDKSYESIFNPANAPAGLTGKAHNFGGGDILQSDSVKGTLLAPGNYTIVLQWVDDIYSLGNSLTGTQNDLDIYLADAQGNPLFGFNRNNIGGDPVEVLPFTVTANTVTNILVVNSSASSGSTTSNIRFKYVVFRGNLKINEYQQGGSTIVGHGNANDAITVGAALYTNTPAYGVNPPTEASFSSRGGTPVNNIVRNKPDLVAPNGNNTTVNFASLDLEGDGIPNFYGTSAAAPHVAGAVALILEGRKKYFSQDMSPANMKLLLQTTAIDMRAPGFDFATGWGFIQADSALRTFANPKPQIKKLELADSSLTPGLQPMELRVIGDFMTSSTKIIFGTDTLTTTVLSNSIASATIPTFFSEKIVYTYTAPQSTSLLDGGISNGLSMTGIPKKNISVIANNKAKKFAEQLPAFNATVLIDGDSLHNTTYTLADLGLQNMIYETPATVNSNTGIYFIRPIRVFNPQVPADSVFLEKYNYGFADGALTITKLAVTIQVRDTTLAYGQRVAGFNFNYSYDQSAIIPDPGSLINSIKLAHTSQVESNVIGLVNAQAVTIVNGQAIPIVNGQAVTIVNGQAVTIVNGQAIPIVNAQAITIVNGHAIPIVNSLTDAQVENLSFLATAPTLANTRSINSSYVVNGVPVPQTTTVVDITQESILKYNQNSAQTTLTSAVTNVNDRGLVDYNSLSNSQAITIVNAQAVTIVNGQAIPIVNGQAVTIVNGQAVTIVNGQAIPIVNGQDRTATIIDETDIGNGLSPVRSINLVTGLTAGTQMILPAALLSDNLTLSYNTGVLTILPVAASIAADTKVIFKGDPLPVFTSQLSGFMPSDTPVVNYSLSPVYAGLAGVYDIVPALVPFAGSANYSVTITNGKLYVNPKGAGAKKLRPYLDCVQIVNPPVNGMGYVARFYCINDNATPVYIPVGVDNKITSTGTFDIAGQPVLFMPGNTYFNAPFDGTTLKWELRSFETNKKTSTASIASSGSNKCNNTYMRGGVAEEPVQIPVSAVQAYPIPATNKVTINFGNDPAVNVTGLYDVYGRSYAIRFKQISKNVIELDLSGLTRGIYFIRGGAGKLNVKILKE